MAHERQRHHFNPFRTDRTDLTGFAATAIPEGDSHSECSNCNVKVKVGSTGGTKFWVNGRWVTKRPPCRSEAK